MTAEERGGRQSPGVRPGRGPRRGAGRSGRLRGDSRGSVHILETMLVGIMVVGAVVAISTLNVPVSHTEGYKASQERIVQDALDSLLARPSHDTSRAMFGSLLEEYVLKAVAGEPGPLMSYLNRTMPPGADYNVFLDNGFGRPVPVIESGVPVGEAVAGSSTFVPRLAYVFQTPEFGVYHEDFHMNVLALPMHNSILQRDEGEAVELAITIAGDDGSEVVLRKYGHTALRHNDADARSWPALSLYAKSPDDKPTHYVDASDAVLYQTFLTDPELGSEYGLLGEAYNVTFDMELLETAGHNVPRGATMIFHFPRGWDFDSKKRAYVESSPDLGNADYWHNFQWSGTSGSGWTVSAQLKDPFKSGTVPFVMSSNFRSAVDSAYPHFSPIVVEMSKGVQGLATVLVDTPQPINVGGFRHEGYLSTSKPLISDHASIWGMSFANLGTPSAEYEAGKAQGGGDLPSGNLRVKKVELRQPQGIRLFEDITPVSGWATGDWAEVGPGHFVWTPTAASGASVDDGEAAYLTFQLTGGPTRDNHYRNHDYQELLFHYSPHNSTGPFAPGHTPGAWNHSQRAFHMGAEWVFRELVPPYEDEDAGQLGWPEHATWYWFGGEANQQRRTSVGNASFGVDTLGVLSQTSGDYQGSHVYSRVQIVDPDGAPQHQFAVGDRVHIKNDFHALFGAVGAMRAGSTLDVTDISVRSSVYTPERAWTGTPTKVFEEMASQLDEFGVFEWMFAVDVTENGIPDVIGINGDGLIVAIDGRDGSKLWIHDAGKDFVEATLADVTGDGQPEAVLATDENDLLAIDTRLNTPKADRHLWSLALLSAAESLSGVAPHTVTALEDLTGGQGTPGEPMVAVAISASAGASWVRLVTATGGPSAWTPAKAAKHSAEVSGSDLDVAITDLAALAWKGATGPDHLAVAAMNETITLLALPDLASAWITKLPYSPADLHVADLDGDAYEDLVVNTGAASLATEASGDHVYVLAGRTGHLGAAVRQGNGGNVLDVAVRGDGAVVGTQGTSILLNHAGGLYGETYTERQSACGVPDFSSKYWRGAHASADGELYLIEEDGILARAAATCDDHTIAWDLLDGALPTHAGAYGEAAYVELHAYEPDQPGGVLYGLTEWGDVVQREPDGSTWFLDNACAKYGCVDPILRWRIEEDEDGHAERFWAAIPLGARARIVSYELGAGWTDHGISTGTAKDLALAPDGTATVVGSLAGAPYAESLAPGAGAWAKELFFRGNATGELQATILAMHVDAGGVGWAVDNGGQAWRRAEAGAPWIPFATRGIGGTAVHAQLAEDPDGTVWAFFDGYRHFPLATYADQAEVHLPHTVALDPAKSALDTNRLVVTGFEGHLGGSALTPPNTDVRWHFRYSPASPWTLMERQDTNLPDGIHDVDHFADVDCEANPCDAIELKATLSTETRATGNGFRQDAGASPALFEVLVTQVAFDLGDPIIPEVLAYLSPDELTSDDERAHRSAFHGGWQLATESPRWAYRGIPYNGNPIVAGDQTRMVAVADGPLTSADTRPGVVVTERGEGDRLDWLAAPIQLWVLDGADGAPVQPASGEFHRPPGYDYIDQIITGDLTGDGIENVAFIGYFNDLETLGTDHVAYLLDTETGEWHLVPTTDDRIVTAAAYTGRDKGRPTFAFARGETMSNVTVTSPDESDEVTSWFGPVGGDPELRWTTQPVQSQGFATFSYEIPRHAMFGTAVVVSELVFDIHLDGSTTLTQTARLVDWFDILPPGQKRSTPPVYTVEVVAWFPGG